MHFNVHKQPTSDSSKLQTIILNFMKMTECSQNGEKTWWESRNCSIYAISPFPTKDL